jgi:hypothetical protein
VVVCVGTVVVRVVDSVAGAVVGGVACVGRRGRPVSGETTETPCEEDRHDEEERSERGSIHPYSQTYL